MRESKQEKLELEKEEIRNLTDELLNAKRKDCLKKENHCSLAKKITYFVAMGFLLTSSLLNAFTNLLALPGIFAGLTIGGMTTSGVFALKERKFNNKYYKYNGEQTRREQLKIKEEREKAE